VSTEVLDAGILQLRAVGWAANTGWELHVDDGTDDLVDLAIFGGVGGGVSVGDGGRKGLWLECALLERSAQRWGAGSTSDAAVTGQPEAPMAPSSYQG
jgi:hypothetical protein